MSSEISEKKYCTNCNTSYTIQSMSCCSNCNSTQTATFLVDDRFSDLKQFKANRNLENFSKLYKD